MSGDDGCATRELLSRKTPCAPPISSSIYVSLSDYANPPQLQHRFGDQILLPGVQDRPIFWCCSAFFAFE